MSAARTHRSSGSARGARLVASGILAVPLAVAAVAFACSPNATIALSSPQGIAGSTVTVFGTAFDRVTGPVQLSVAGRSVGSTTQSSFSLPVTIPDLPPAVYFVTATGRVGEDVYTHVASFEVTSSSAAGTSPSGAPAGSDPAGGDVGSPGAGPVASTDAAPSGQTGAATGPAAAKAPKTQGASRADAPRRGTGSSRRETGAARERAVSRVALAAPPPATVRTDSGQRVFAASVAPPRGAAAPRSSAARERVADRPAASPATAERPAAGDRGDNASLLTGTSDSMQSGGPDNKLAVGLVLMGVGVMLVLGGFVVAEARRRRVPASADRRQLGD